MAQIAQPRGAVDHRPGVVALIAQQHLAGVDPDAQPDRRQRCPLQLQRTGRRVGRAGERRHKTVTLTLLDRPHTAMGGNQITQRVIQARKGRRHLLGLGLPQPCGALDVGQKQRRRSRRQKPAHAKVAPVHQRRVDRSRS